MPKLNKLLRKGNWSPLLPYGARMIVVILLQIEAILRGLDYVTGDYENTASSLTFVEKAMPLEVWGTFFLIAGVLSLIGYWRKWPYVCIAGMFVGGGAYSALAAGFILKTIERGGDGFRTPTMFLVFAFAFWGMAVGYSIQMKEEREKKEALGW